METITIQKSVKNITFGNDVFESKLIEKYQFCVRAVVMDVETVNFEAKLIAVCNSHFHVFFN